MTSLDRETRSSYELIVTATDRGAHALSSTAKVLITVEDINDNSPNVTGVPQEVRISEETLPGKYLKICKARVVNYRL